MKFDKNLQEIFVLSLRFYIGCDRCQDWFHGRCVGILQSEAEQIERYICPNCQSNSQVNAANQHILSTEDYDQLKRLLSGLKVIVDFFQWTNCIKIATKIEKNSVTCKSYTV